MHSRNNTAEELMTANEKSILKEIKRDLIRFVPPLVRRTRKFSKEFETPERYNFSCDYGKTFDHQNPTMAFSLKCQEFANKSLSDFKMRVKTSQSTERAGKAKILVSREDKSYNPKKLVYPSVKKLKNWMNTTEGRTIKEVSQLKKILFDHINKNMKHLNLKVSKEIEAPSISKISRNAHPMKLPEIQKLDRDFKRIKVNHKNTGIMRRNKLLLEHIMHERIRSKQIYKPGLQHYRTNISTMA